jgi:nucleoside-diphosphate kinase
MEERTVALIKPDAWERHLVGHIIERIEQRNLSIDFMMRYRLAEGEAVEFYGRQHRGRSYFVDLVNFTASGPILAMVLSGEQAIRVWRQMMGPASVDERPSGTIRGDLARGVPNPRNLVHGSDSQESYRHEVATLYWCGLPIGGL